MRWIRFMTADGPTFGILHRTVVWQTTGDPFSSFERTGQTFDLHAVSLLVPIEPGTFYAVGRNYRSHIDAVYRVADPGAKDPDRPEAGYRANSALIAHGHPIVIPADAGPVHYEGELVVVIGKEGKHIREADALGHVFGYTIGNDVSERNWQKSDRTMWRSKNTDTFKPMGPWIETDADPDAMQTTVMVNGEVTSQFRTSDMIFGVARYISAISQYCTLRPGDVIWMGTAGASPDLKDGDRVEIGISGIGTLCNTVEKRGDPA
ncbi:fumarylacetoacetate hydrolase family protein [Paraburkholderia tropica]|uniref:fumarylacetoacetate hydrolase family protein n=1 Tax=Paraburkholderia tropica TaxID=92647 RepID=UPI003016C71D